jgi:hypothetical protein
MGYMDGLRAQERTRALSAMCYYRPRARGCALVRFCARRPSVDRRFAHPVTCHFSVIGRTSLEVEALRLEEALHLVGPSFK